MGQYKNLITFQVEHQFFENSPGLNLKFELTEASITLVRNAGLIITASNQQLCISGTEASVDVISALAHESEHASEGDGDEENPHLSFKISCADSEFSSYTHVESLSRDTIPYLNNLDLDLDLDQGHGACQRRLHRGDCVGADDLEKLGSALLSQVLSSKERLVKPLAVVRLELSRAAGFDFHNKAWPVKEYQIVFAAPSRHWMYCIFGADQDATLHIKDLAGSQTFQYEGYKPLENASQSRPAHLYLSEQQLPLRKRSEFRFQLSRASDLGEQVLVNPLPVAQCRQSAKVENSAGEKMIQSHIYVNV